MLSNASRSLIHLSLVAVFLLLAANQIAAQDLDNVTLSGRVTDQFGAVIPGALVSATLRETNTERTVITNDDGRYRLSHLRPGNYLLKISANGFATQEKPQPNLLAGQHLHTDFVLAPEVVTAEQTVVISTASASIDTTRTVVGGTIAGREMLDLPIPSRSPLDLIFILPGVTEEPLSTRDLSEDRDVVHASTPEESGTFALAGGPAYSNNLTIDGLDNNDDRAARERIQPSLEAVAEVQVITNQFAAEYGRASGGRINLRTRGGSADFHGRGFYFFRDEALNANTWRNNSLGLKRLPLQQHNFGSTLGGPILFPRNLRDRTFFFAAYEFDTLLDHALIDTLVPLSQNPRFLLPLPTFANLARFEDVSEPALSTGVAPFVSRLSTPMKNHLLSVRIDHQFSETHHGFLSVHSGRLSNLRQFSGGNRLAEALQARTRNSDSFAYTNNLVLGSSLVNETRVQFSRLSPSLKAGQSGPVVLIAINDSLPSDDAAYRSGTLVAGGSTAGATDRHEARMQWQNITSLNHRQHSLRFGFDLQRIRSTFVDLADSSGTFSFASAGDFLAGIASRYRQNFLTESTQRNTYLGLFVQDEWRPKDNLTISFGLRYERETILRDLNNFGPRFSVAYDPFTTGRTVVRFGLGLFYNRVLLRTIDDFTLGQQRLFFDTNNLRDPVTSRRLSAEERRGFITVNLSFPQILSVDSPLVKQFAERDLGFSRRLDPALRVPESYQLNLGVERDVGAGFVFEANYTLNRGIHLWREFNANAPVLPAGYQDFTEYLASRDFANFRLPSSGQRPLYNASSAGELVRFVFNGSNSTNPNAIGRVMEFGVPVSLFNLNSVTSSTAIEVALAALNHLRPDPERREVEQLVSAGNSFYRGLTLELRRQFQNNFSFRIGYTYSHLIDDGVVNTSDALRLGDFRAERARSLLDRRHRVVLSGTVRLPKALGRLQLSPLVRASSGAPFNISLGGLDRNLDDVSNDRPIFVGDIRLLRWRAPGDGIDPNLLAQFRLPAIGQSGNLPRNAGIGPGVMLFDLNVTREFQLTERVRLRAGIEFDNVLNRNGFSFGSEFINFNALSPTATAEQRQAFVDSFLVATRTMRHRQVRIGVRVEF